MADDRRDDPATDTPADSESAERPNAPTERDRLNDTSAYQRCFACGARNDAGLRLTFWHEGDAVVTEFTATEAFQGFPGVVHGGILATLLDETLNRTAMAEGRWTMTGRLDVRYRAPAPVGQTLRVTARPLSSRARMIHASGEIRLKDAPHTVIATAEGLFMPVPGAYQREASDRFPEYAGFFDI
ncbi:MAG TPA: PaaI family thioesterase [Ktedonobacterales bacterium]|nr:PaaI family thioesterase [Ktedonobacterales bacterium]